MTRAFDRRTTVNICLVLIVLCELKVLTVINGFWASDVAWEALLCWAGFYMTGRLLISATGESDERICNLEKRLIWISLAAGVLCGGVLLLMYLNASAEVYINSLLRAAAKIVSAIVCVCVMAILLKGIVPRLRLDRRFAVIMAAIAGIEIAYQCAVTFVWTCLQEYVTNREFAWWNYNIIHSALNAMVFTAILLLAARLFFEHRPVHNQTD